MRAVTAITHADNLFEYMLQLVVEIYSLAAV